MKPALLRTICPLVTLFLLFELKSQELPDSLINKVATAANPNVLWRGYAEQMAFYAQRDQLERAIALGNHLLATIKEGRDTEGYAKFLSNIGLCYKINGQFDSAGYFMGQSYDVAKAGGHAKTLSNTMVNIASVLSRLSQYDSAARVLEMAIPVLVEVRDSVGLANAHNNLGNKYSALGRYYEALTNQLLALDIYEALQLDQRTRVSLLAIGNTYRYMKDVDRAIEYYYKTLDGDTVLTDRYLGNVHTNLGGAFLENNAPAQAVEELRIGLQYWIRRNCMTIYPMTTMAQAFLAMGELDSAKYYADIALRESGSCGETSITATNHKVLGDFHYSRQEFTQAEQQWLRAYALSESIGRKDLMQDIALQLYEFYEERRNWPEAFLYLKSYTGLTDSLLNKEKIEEISMLEAEYQFDNERRGLEVERQRERQKAQAALRDQRNLIIASVVFSILLGLIAYLINRNRMKEHKTKVELEKLNTLNTKILGVLSHDLKSPLFALQNTIALFEAKRIDQEQLEERTRHLNLRLSDTSLYMNNLLRWAQSQLNELKPQLEMVKVRELVDHAMVLLKPLASEKGVTLSNECLDQHVAELDNEMMQIVIRNLVANAIKYSKEGDMVVIDSAEAESDLLINVRDEGTGISEETLKDIFNNTAPVVAGTNQEIGTGLGLMLSRELAEKNNARLSATSELGKRSTFTVSIGVS